MQSARTLTVQALAKIAFAATVGLVDKNATPKQENTLFFNRSPYGKGKGILFRDLGVQIMGFP